ncbi:MAG: LysR substrate-binding domain-containing protein [Lautropia sp.]
METRQLRYFCFLAEELNFRRASARAHVAQPALTRQIQQLEAELGVTLLTRTTRKVALTPAGEAFKTYALKSMRDFERAKLDAQRIQQGDRGKLVVGFVPSVANTLMPKVLRNFRKSSRLTELDLKASFSTEQFRSLMRGEIDVGVLKPWHVYPEIKVQILASEPFVVAVPADHPLAGRAGVPLEQFRKDPFIMHARYSTEASRTFDLMMVLFREAGFEPRVAPEAPQDMHMALTMVGAGFGVSILPRSILTLGVPGTAFTEIREATAQSQIAVAHRFDNDNPAVALFVRAARRTLRSAAGFERPPPAQGRRGR